MIDSQDLHQSKTEPNLLIKERIRYPRLLFNVTKAELISLSRVLTDSQLSPYI